MISRKRICFLSLLVSFIGGIFISSFIQISYVIAGELLIAGFLLLFILPKKKVLLVAFILIGLSGAFFRFNLNYDQLESSPLLNFQNETATIEGEVVKVVNKNSIQEITLEVDKINHDSYSKDQILIKSSPFNSYQKEDRLKVSGKIKEPSNFQGFNYQGYLAKKGISSVMYYPKIEKIKEGYTLLNIKQTFSDNIKKHFSPPHSSLLEAITLGNRQDMSSDFKEKLNRAGLSHITAISGMHIIIIAELIAALLLFLGLHRKYLFYGVAGILLLYLLLVGFRASIVRAIIMGLIVFWGEKIGRPAVSITSLLIAAVIILLINPFLLRLDVGFQLSFLAAAGIILLKPVLEKFLTFLSPRRLVDNLILITLAAQIATLPLVVYHFQALSLVGLIGNILIVPVLPFLLGGALLFLLLTSVFNFLGSLIALILYPLVDFVVRIVNILGSFSLASVSLEINILTTVIFYFLLGGLIFIYHQKKWYLPF